MNGNSLKGMTVISMQEGTRLGQVQQPLFDLASRQLGALQVKGDSGMFIVSFAQIESIGTDAITVASSQVAETPSPRGVEESLLDLQSLGKLKIVDQAGTFLGTLTDVEIDPASGRITQIAAHKGGLLGLGGTTTPLGEADTLMVGPELLTVTTDGDRVASSDRWVNEGGTVSPDDAPGS